ncbi:MAG: hypothetical protein ACHBN1_04120 [Heteroscytonema crispum UTEX LB 1556]
MASIETPRMWLHPLVKTDLDDLAKIYSLGLTLLAPWTGGWGADALRDRDSRAKPLWDLQRLEHLRFRQLCVSPIVVAM